MRRCQGERGVLTPLGMLTGEGLGVVRGGPVWSLGFDREG